MSDYLQRDGQVDLWSVETIQLLKRHQGFWRSFMILIGMFFLSVVATIIFVKWLSSIHGFWKSVWWGAGVMSLIRVALVCTGQLLMTTTGGPGQLFGYLMLMFSLPEALFARGLRNHSVLWAVVVSLFVSLGSFVWVFSLAFFFARKSR